MLPSTLQNPQKKYLRASAVQTQLMGFGVDLVTIS